MRICVLCDFEIRSNHMRNFLEDILGETIMRIKEDKIWLKNGTEIDFFCAGDLMRGRLRGKRYDKTFEFIEDPYILDKISRELSLMTSYLGVIGGSNEKS